MENVFKEESKEETLSHVAFKVIGQFETLLDRENIAIPNKEREGKKDEACIYGTHYYDLEEAIKEVLSAYF